MQLKSYLVGERQAKLDLLAMLALAVPETREVLELALSETASA